MSKKILSIMLSLVMVMSLLTGCGEKDSTFFKEVKEMSKISTGEATVEMNMSGTVDENDGVPAQLLDADGKLSVGMKMDLKQESKTKIAMKFALKLGTASDYQDVTTIAVDDSKVYVDVAPLIAFVKTIDEEAATSAEATLSQIGVTDSLSIDYKQVIEAMGSEVPEAQELDKETLEKVNSIFDKVENDFKDLQGKDGDDYTLSVNGDNAEKAVDAMAAFFENDCEEILTICVDVVKQAYGEDSEFASMYDELLGDTSSLKETAQQLKDSKEDIVSEIKESKINIVAKARTTGDEGSRNGKLSLETGDMTFEEDGVSQSANISFSATIKEGTPSIADMIPENAADITTLVITMINAQMEGAPAIDGGIIGGGDDATDMQIDDLGVDDLEIE